MKQYILAALMALAIAVPGAATASPLFTVQVNESPEMDPLLVEDILKAAAEQCSYTYEELDNLYHLGEILIEKISSGYRVNVSGGSAIVLIEDSL